MTTKSEAVPGDTGRQEPTEDLPDRSVTAHSSSPDRIVFTETGNCDGWIASDVVVELYR